MINPLTIFDRIWEASQNILGSIFKFGVGLIKAYAGIAVLVSTILWLLLQLLGLFMNWLVWIADNASSVLDVTLPINASFPGGYADVLAFANSIFPLQEAFVCMSFLSLLWIAVATFRILKSCVPGWS